MGRLKKITSETHTVLVEDLILYGEIESVEWQCSVLGCENTGKTRQMYSLDIGPFGRNKVLRPLNNSVLCPKCANRIMSLKTGHKRYAQIFKLVDLINWLKELKLKDGGSR